MMKEEYFVIFIKLLKIQRNKVSFSLLGLIKYGSFVLLESSQIKISWLKTIIFTEQNF